MYYRSLCIQNHPQYIYCQKDCQNDCKKDCQKDFPKTKCFQEGFPNKISEYCLKKRIQQGYTEQQSTYLCSNGCI